MKSHRILTPDEVLPADPGTTRVRRRRRSSRRRRQRNRLLLSLCLLAATLASAMLAWEHDTPVRRFAKEFTDINLTLPPVASTPARRLRPTYRYSVVPGGVYSRSELEVAVSTDRVVAEHYRDFDVARAYVTRVDKPRPVYVSYRVGDKVYWSRRKIWLRAGEALLTDGEALARGRCGNRVADIIDGPEPIAPDELLIGELDEPIEDVPPGISPLRAFDLMFVATPEVAPQPPPYEPPPLPSSKVPIISPPTLVVDSLPAVPEGGGPVPEPGTLTLVVSGAALFIRRRLKQRT